MRYMPLYRLSVSTAPPPSPGPTGRLVGKSSITFSIEVLSVSGNSGYVLVLQLRAYGTAALWSTIVEDASPSVGAVLETTNLTPDSVWEWRLVEMDAAGNIFDGTHGVVNLAVKAPSAVTEDCRVVKPRSKSIRLPIPHNPGQWC